MVSKEEQIKLYKEELEEINLETKQIFESPASFLFQTGQIFVGQYKGYDKKRGNIFIDINSGIGFHSPRIDQSFCCFKLIEGNHLPKLWENASYDDLLDALNLDKDTSDVNMVDFMQSDRTGFIRLIINQVDINFVASLKHNQIIGLGPKIPPFDYILNLIKFSNAIQKNEEPWNKILNFEYTYVQNRIPKIIDESIDIAEYIIKESDKKGIFILQGPPGTGKTHQIANVISRLAINNKSVLLTALTNKAAIEVCGKETLNLLMKEGKVYKTSISTSENVKFPFLRNIKEIIPIPGEICLTTYYQFSKYWEDAYKSFDYVIVEEASQAFLTTIAAAFKLGKKIIIVGDPYQIEPILKYTNFNKISPQIDKIKNGLQTICNFTELPFYRKIETRRLTERATKYTNCFYQNTMISKSLYVDLKKDIKELPFFGKYIHELGGPSLILQNSNTIDYLEAAVLFLIKSIDEINASNLGSIAVLTPFIKIATYLQKELKIKTKSKKYLIDTIDRVQGLDVDYCFVIIPNGSYNFSLYKNRFNVATSRSKKATIIIMDNEFKEMINFNNESGMYLKLLLNESNSVFILD